MSKLQATRESRRQRKAERLARLRLEQTRIDEREYRRMALEQYPDLFENMHTGAEWLEIERRERNQINL